MNEDSVRVLIVDDQAPFRDVARLVIDMTGGFEIVGEAQTGEASVEMAEALDPDLILMDVNLPGIDGTEATKRILGQGSKAVVLLLSTYEEAEYEPKARDSGASAYIPKSSFDPDRLKTAWESAKAEKLSAGSE
jgi:two-component system, NarL family, invasion response regulator UvrY